MAEVGTGVATNLAQRLVDRAIKEAQYLCCFKSYVEDFEKGQNSLSAARSRVLKDIEESRKRNETEIEGEVQSWLDEVNGLIQEDTKAKKKLFFGLCTNCYWQHQQGKKLEKKMQEIPKLIEESKNFPRVARSAGLPGIKFHASPDFIYFKSRESKFEELKKALKDENNRMIGLQGMGGTGKTTMVKEIGKEVQQLKLFDKVIFTVVSNSPDIQKIQGSIAGHLEFTLKEEESVEHAEKLWDRIVNGEEKVLIILDDIWNKDLNLKDIGIPVGRHEKGCCSVLLTTRDLGICKAMKCHKTIQLELLSEEDSLDLLQSNAGKSGDDFSNDFKDVGLRIVKECGRLPVAIVAVAKALYSERLEDWKATTRLKCFEPLKQDVVDEEMTKVYNSLGLSYDNLNNRAQELLLLCSLFPEDYGIPIELFSRIAIGLGLCGDVNKYKTARSQVLIIKNKLIDSSLLLKAEEERVKMHDLVREVAHLIAKNKIQVITDSKSTLKENIEYSSWNIDRFPNCFGGNKLKFLLAWVNANDFVEVPNALFDGMMELRVLLLICTQGFRQTPAPSLMQSILSLKNIRTLILEKWELRDLSIVGSLQCLETLELKNCLITELPNEVKELEKLRLLSLITCIIEQNNPFEVIATLSLEELYYVDNEDMIAKGNEDPQKISLPRLRRYHIVAPWSVDIHKVDASISRCFDPSFSKNIFSEETFKSMAARATVLQSEGCTEKRWTNLIPDIVRMEDGGMKDLTRLSLRSWSKIECLINTKDLQSSVTNMPKLVELELYKMKVKELFCGPLPIDFLKQLERLHLEECLNLESTLLKGKLDLGKLKSIYLDRCSMASLFYPSTAQSLQHLEELKIHDCSELEYIITNDGVGEEKVEDRDDPNQNGLGRMFPKLKSLFVSKCDKLEFVLPICFVEDLRQLEELIVLSCKELKYIYGQYPGEGGLHQKEKEITLPSLTELDISWVPKLIGIYPESYHPMSSVMQKSSPIITRDGSKLRDPSPSYNFPWVCKCCFLPKSRPTTIDNLSGHTSSQALKTEWVFNTTLCLLRSPLNLCSLREIDIWDCSNLTSLFTLPIASSLLLLESLKVHMCHGLKHIVTGEGDGYDRMKCSFFFPKLRQVIVRECDLLESLFPASHVRTLDHLEELHIYNAPKLRYLFQKCCKDNVLHQSQNVEIHLELPALKELLLVDVPNMVNICLTASSLKEITLERCPQFTIRPFMDSMVGWHERQDLTMKKAQAIIEMQPLKLDDIDLHNIDIETIFNLERQVQSSLAKMLLEDLPELRDVCVGPKYALRLQNLQELRIKGCKKLRVVFSASILRSLPQLKILKVKECEELVHIIEENEQNPIHSHQVCFPKLSVIEIYNCKSLKCLFSISTCDNLPKLQKLKIEDAPELVQVFGCEQGEAEDLVMEDLLPKLSDLQLINLQILESVYQGIDFNMIATRDVQNCPKISLTSSIESKEDPTNEAQVAPYERKTTEINLTESKMEAPKEDVEEELPIQEQGNSSSNLTESTAAVNEIVEEDPISEIPATKAPSSNSDMSREIPQHTPSTEIMQNIEVDVGEGPSSQKYNKKKHEKEAMGDQELLGGNISTNEADGRVDQPLDNAQEVEEPTNECSFEEKSNKTALEDNSSLISLISTSKKRQIVTAATQIVPEGSQSTKLDIFGNTELPQDKLISKEAKTKTTIMNIEVSATEGPSLEMYNKATSSTHSKPEMHEKESMGDRPLGESISTDETLGRVDKPLDNAEEVEESTDKSSSKKNSDKTASEDNSPLISLISTSENPQMVNAATHTEPVSSQSKQSDISRNTDSPQGQIMVDETERCIEEDDLIRLFHIIEGGVDTEVGRFYNSKMATLEDDNKVVVAFADLEASLKMALNEIASSEDNILRLENALSFLSTYCFQDGAPSHGLKATMDSLNQEIQSIISSFRQTSATIHTFPELEEREKNINVERSQRKKAAANLVSEIFETEKFISEAQQKEMELKEHISRLQVELSNIEKDIKDSEIKLSSLQDQKKNRFSDTLRFIQDFEAVKRDKFQMVEEQIKARQELENVDVKWSSCVANLKKTTLLLGIYLKQKL